MSFQRKSLIQQGYCHLDTRQLESLRWGLRFTPTVCMAAAVFGLTTHNVPLLLGLAALGIVPFWFPKWHPVDRFYNAVVAPLFGASRLPPNPLPRRIACVSAGVMNTSAAVALSMGAVKTAYVIGGMLFVLQLIVNTTHFCLASFLIELGLKLVGKSLPSQRVDGDEARRLVEAGAMLIDVRDESEFAMGHIPGAVNIPLERLRGHVAELGRHDKTFILYCKSGGRSRIGVGLLASAGLCGIHDLGGMDRWPDEGESALA